MLRKEQRISKRITSLLFANLAALLLGLLWLDYLGAIDIKAWLRAAYTKIVSPKPRKPGLALLEGELYKRKMALEELERKLAVWEKSLQEKEQKLLQKEKELAEKEKSLEEQKKALEERMKAAKTHEERVKELAYYFSTMKPTEGVKRLQELDDSVIIEIFDHMDRDTVTYYLMLMDPKRAARIIDRLQQEGKEVEF